MADARYDSLAVTLPCSSANLADLHKVYVDDMSYNYGHGHAYQTLGVDPEEGAMIIVRPDQCKFQHGGHPNPTGFL